MRWCAQWWRAERRRPSRRQRRSWSIWRRRWGARTVTQSPEEREPPLLRELRTTNPQIRRGLERNVSGISWDRPAKRDTRVRDISGNPCRGAYRYFYSIRGFASLTPG